MKIQYNRYTEMSCFKVRGQVGAAEWKMLSLGFTIIFKTLEEMFVINLVHAEIEPAILPLILEFKKGIAKLTKQKVFIISKERGLGDFPKIEVLLSRFQGSKMRQIGDRIILEDQIYALEQEIISIEAQIQKLGFDENTSKKEIQKNIMVKTQKKSLEGCIKWQKQRKEAMQKVASEEEDLDAKLKSTIEEVTKVFGKELNL